LAFAQEEGNRERWETCVVKPGGVLAKGGWVSGVLPWVLGSGCAIRLDESAAVMVNVAVNGLSETVLWNTEMVKKGKELLARNGKRGGAVSNDRRET
jgi:hypothetical protein